MTRILTTRTSDGVSLQDLRYTYDAVGNITRVRDKAQASVYFSNNLVTADRDYTFDALYRLSQATGREHVNYAQPTSAEMAAVSAVPDANNPQALTTYTETYEYDGWTDSLKQYLGDIQGIAPLPIEWLLGFSLVYLFFIGPLDYGVLRLLQRQPLTWITFPIIIVVFSTVALVGTAWVKGSEAHLRVLEVVDVLPGTDQWRGSSYAGIWATGRATVTVASSRSSWAATRSRWTGSPTPSSAAASPRPTC